MTTSARSQPSFRLGGRESHEREFADRRRTPLKGYAGVALTSTAVPSSSSGVALTGATIDRLSLAPHVLQLPSRSASARFVASTTVQSCPSRLSFQHSSDGTSWDSYSTATATNAAAVGSTGATTARWRVEGLVEQNVNLVGARRYVRQVITPTFSDGTSGDSALRQRDVVFGGADERPARRTPLRHGSGSGSGVVPSAHHAGSEAHRRVNTGRKVAIVGFADSYALAPFEDATSRSGASTSCIAICRAGIGGSSCTAARASRSRATAISRRT
jgi:hypothetical protein